MEQKNLISAILISAVFLLVWFSVVVPRLAPPSANPPHAPIQATATNLSNTGTSLSPANENSSVQAANAPSASADTLLSDSRNDVLFTSAGGSVRHWTIKTKGQDIDLVESSDAPVLPLATFPEIPFSLQQQGNSIVMKGKLSNGVILSKTLTLRNEGFLQDLTLEFRNPTNAPVEIRNWEFGWGPGIGTAVAELKENNRLIRTIYKDALNAHSLKPGEYDIGQWGAIDNRYFMAAFIPPPNAHPILVISGTHEQARVSLRDTTTIPAHATVSLPYEIYVGPKGFTQLKHYNKHLEAAVDFGTFSALGKLILSVIYRLHELTGNYGWAIILLTIGLQILLIPLTMKSMRAQAGMRRLQPQIAALQKKYKSDPKQLNVEMMTLYKNTGTNPFGGCLPMVLQLPIFWALFTALRNAYELRGAPFILWIHDLAAPDPLHILPVVMGGAMFLQQRMTGAATDPTQRQMMFIMPIMFTFMFFNFPAGLVLYWFTNNLVMLVFQYFFQRNQSNPGQGTADSPQIINP